MGVDLYRTVAATAATVNYSATNVTSKGGLFMFSSDEMHNIGHSAACECSECPQTPNNVRDDNAPLLLDERIKKIEEYVNCDPMEAVVERLGSEINALKREHGYYSGLQRQAQEDRKRVRDMEDYIRQGVINKDQKAYLVNIVHDEIDALFPGAAQAKGNWKDEALDAFKREAETLGRLEEWMTAHGRVERRISYLTARTEDAKASASFWKKFTFVSAIAAGAQLGYILSTVLL